MDSFVDHRTIFVLPTGSDGLGSSQMTSLMSLWYLYNLDFNLVDGEKTLLAQDVLQSKRCISTRRARKGTMTSVAIHLRIRCWCTMKSIMMLYGRWCGNLGVNIWTLLALGSLDEREWHSLSLQAFRELFLLFWLHVCAKAGNKGIGLKKIK